MGNRRQKILIFYLQNSALDNQGPILQKSLANIQEIKARGGPIIAITSAGMDFPSNLADEIIQFPASHECIEPLLASIPVQLLAYDIAVNRGCDVDKPRNMAKPVTVE